MQHSRSPPASDPKLLAPRQARCLEQCELPQQTRGIARRGDLPYTLATEHYVNLTMRLNGDGCDGRYFADVESIDSVPIAAAMKYETIITPRYDREHTHLGSSLNPMY